MDVPETQQVSVLMASVHARWKESPVCVDIVSGEAVSWLTMTGETTAGCKHCMNRNLVTLADLKATRGNLSWATGEWQA